MKKFGQSLEKIVAITEQLKLLHKKDLQSGDLVVINTQNSVYFLHVLNNGFYMVSGGWFDSKGLSPMKIRITGCSWGSSIIKLDIVAARGLCLEFGNCLVTSPIKNFFVIPSGYQN